jgi:hypothetical protein
MNLNLQTTLDVATVGANPVSGLCAESEALCEIWANTSSFGFEADSALGFE